MTPALYRSKREPRVVVELREPDDFDGFRVEWRFITPELSAWSPASTTSTALAAAAARCAMLPLEAQWETFSRARLPLEAREQLERRGAR